VGLKIAFLKYAMLHGTKTKLGCHKSISAQCWKNSPTNARSNHLYLALSIPFLLCKVSSKVTKLKKRNFQSRFWSTFPKGISKNPIGNFIQATKATNLHTYFLKISSYQKA
jgi:hypothetical protein